MSGLREVRDCESSLDAEITPKLLLVCGASAAGKSVFINALMKGQLPRELTDLLSDVASNWQTIEANDLLKRGNGIDTLAGGPGTAPGMILHYDIFFAKRAGLETYSDDPISPILFEARDLRIVYIKPNPQQLRAQFDKRLQSQLKRKGPFRSAWARRVRKPVKELKRRLFGVGRPYTEDLYATSGLIDRCYADWERFLQELVEARPSARIMEVIPAGNGKQNFILTQSSCSIAPAAPPVHDAAQAARRAAV